MKADLINLYGPTEATIEVTAELVTAEEDAVAVGRPIDNARIYVLDGCGQPTPIGVRGEIHIGGLPLARGYLHQDELTRQRFVLDPFDDTPNARIYRTGDLGAWRPDGRLDFLGRIDGQVTSGSQQTEYLLVVLWPP